MKIKTVSKIIIALLTMGSCFGQKSEKLRVLDRQVFEFNLSHVDTIEGLGIPKESHFEIGPTSPVIIGEDIYIVDAYFNRVVKVTKVGDVFASNSLTNGRNIQRLSDLSFNDESLYVLSDFATGFELNYNLNVVDTFYTIEGRCQKKFLSRGDNPKFYDLINKKYYLLKNAKPLDINERFTQWQSYLGADYSLENDRTVVVMKQGKLHLNEPIQDITLDFYQCRNIAFSNSVFAHFKISPDRRKLLVYRYKYE